LGLTDRQVVGSNLNFFNVLNSDVNVKVESIGADIAVGNQWQWNQMTIGCDWIGLMVPFAVVNADYDRSGVTDIERQSIEVASRKLGLLMSFQVARVYVGASF
jgi:hypothetical protein